MTNFNEKLMELNKEIKWYDHVIDYQLNRTDDGASDATRAEIIAIAYERRKHCLELVKELKCCNNNKVWRTY